MCSIFGVLDIKTDVKALRQQALQLSKLLRHRGPDWSGIWNDDNAILVHERLAIVDTENGAQPLINPNRNHILAVNGEIYNHKNLEKNLTVDYQFQTKSDCEVILPLYLEHGADFIDQLQGMFAFILYDAEQQRYLIARDHIGIIPLYYGYDEHGQLYVASELKALAPVCKQMQEFPPGHYFDSKVGKLVKYYQRDWQSYAAVKDNAADLGELRAALEHSVKSHLMSDVPYGVLLSGGLDSSLISAITQQFARNRVEDDGKSEAWWPRLHSFAVGLAGSPDLKAARKVADSIGTVHHEVLFTVQEGIDALRDVVYFLETYDVTTIRASTPMYLMARKIKAMASKWCCLVKVLMNCSAATCISIRRQMRKNSMRKPCVNSTVCTCLTVTVPTRHVSMGIEARVPFLDKHFMDVAMRLNPQAKMCGGGKMEKHILREAFTGLLPDEILWRQKEQFSDGVGYSWIDSLKAFAEKEVTDQQMATASFRFPVNTPDTKEGYLYRTIFEEHFPHPGAIACVPGGKSVACSTPEALAWDAKMAQMTDPSGRAVRDVHEKGY